MKTRLVKTLFALTLCLAMLVTALPALAQNQPVQLTLWTIWGGTRVPLMDRILEEFTRTYPHITVEHHVVPGGERFDRFMVATAAGAPPDVMMLGRQEIPPLARDGILLALDEFVERDNVDTSIFFPAELSSGIWDGQLYILPMPTGTAVNNLLYYNQRLFAEAGLDPNRPPATWSELEQYGRMLNRRDADGNLTQLGIDVRSGGDRLFHAWNHSNGGSYASEDRTRFLFGDERGHATMEWLTNFTTQINGGAQAITQFNQRAPESFFNENRAMQTSGSWYLFQALTANPNLELGVGLLPHNEGYESLGVTVGGWGYAVASNVPHPYESWLLTKWLTTSDIGARWFTFEQGRPSPVIEFSRDPSYFDVNPNWSVVIEAMQRSVAVPLTPVEARLWQIEGGRLNPGFNGDMPPRQALDEYVREAQQLLDDYWAGSR